MDSRLAAHDNPGDIAKVVIPNPSAAPNRGSTGIVRRLLIFLAILSLLAAGFMTIHRIVSKEVRRSIEGADLRSLRDIWANVETDLPPESLKDIQAFITNFESHTGVRYDLWLSSLDPVVKALGYDMHAYSLGEASDDNKQLEANVHDAPIAWVVALVPSITQLPPETPIIWTRGLLLDGTWRADSPYGTWGGHMLFTSGATKTFGKQISGIMKWGTQIPTTDIREALPPGTRIGEYVLSAQIIERIRQQRLLVRLGALGGVLLVGTLCAWTSFGRRHWLTLLIIGWTAVYQWWLVQQ